MNKKGISAFDGWITSIVLLILFVAVFGGIVIGGMNDLHPPNYSIEGLGTDDLVDSFNSFQNSSTQKIRDGDISITDLGSILFIDSWTIIIEAFKFVFEFLFGGWIETVVVSFLGLPTIVATLLRGLWVITIILIILSIVFKREI